MENLNNEEIRQVEIKEPAKREPERTTTATTVEKPVYVDPFNSLEEYDPENEKESYSRLIYPANTNKAFLDHRKKLIDNKGEEYIQGFSSTQITAEYAAERGNASTFVNGALQPALDNEEAEFVNNVMYGDKSYVTKSLKLANTKNMNKATALARLNSFMGVGDVIQVPLWHSGFWVTIKPIKQKDFVNLSIAINSSQHALGRRTNGLIYSNYSIIFVNLLTSFIKDHITESTLDLPAGEDIRKYILIQDLQPLVNGLLSAMYCNGIDIIRSCVNSTVLGNDGNPLCDYVVTGTVDPKKLLWVNKKALSKEQINHMSKRTPNSVTVDDVTEYQNNAPWAKTVKYSIKREESSVDINIKAPNLIKYIDDGESWINYITNMLENALAEVESKEKKEQSTEDIILSSRANLYNHFIESAEFNDVKFETYDDIVELLELFSGNDKEYKELFKAITDYINNNVIAVVATPNYTCPKCQANQHEAKGPFKEFIPLNIVDNFFVLGGQRLYQMRENGTY